jgi:enamine deaminase RidA (YjgF/YER057c/UK114 family)
MSRADHIEFIQPEGFARPRGYANGVLSKGRILHVGGQIGWDAEQNFQTDEFGEQFAQALDNVLAVVRAAGGEPEHIVEMTMYATDLSLYRASLRELGPIWKERLGRHYPAMAMVGVAGLVEERALIEIQAVAVLPEEAAK